VKDEVKKRKKTVRAFPSPSANPKGPNYGAFCKYQLLKHKPWRSRIGNAWDGLDEENDDNLFCQKWSEFLQSDLGRTLVPNWQREFSNALLYFESSEDDELKRISKVNVRNGCI